MIHKSNSIYEQGPTKTSELENDSGFITRGTWEDITDKVGNKVNSNVQIKYNRELALLQFFNWGDITNTAKTTIFTFNNDFTDGSWCSGNLVCAGFNSSSVRVPCMFNVRWGDLDAWGADKNTIYVEENVRTCNILQIVVCNKPEELAHYLDTH